MNDIDTMVAGEALDALVAEKVMGWTCTFLCKDPETYGGSVYVWRYAGGLTCRYATDYDVFDRWSPSRNIADAWEVVEHFIALRRGLALDTPFSYTDEGEARGPLYSCTIHASEPNPCDAGYGSSLGDTLPLAICRAALKTLS